MTSRKMHVDELDTDTKLVQQLLCAQFPQWADLPIRRFDSEGTANAIYRLGDTHAARLPLRPGKAEQIQKEHTWLPTFAPHLPLAIPTPLAQGQPTKAYPSHWSICRWLQGKSAKPKHIHNLNQAAVQLAECILALQRIDPTDGPAPGAHNFRRGIPLAQRDASTRRAIASSEGLVDTDAVTAAWETALQTPVWHRAPVWIHGDLSPGNLLASDGQLSGMIDWGGLGVGDPATDLLPAWNMFEGESRATFRNTLGVDDATWARGRGLALSVALVALPYYLNTNAAIVAWARHMIAEVLADHVSDAYGLTAR